MITHAAFESVLTLFVPERCFQWVHHSINFQKSRSGIFQPQNNFSHEPMQKFTYHLNSKKN